MTAGPADDAVLISDPVAEEIAWGCVRAATILAWRLDQCASVVDGDARALDAIGDVLGPAIDLFRQRWDETELLIGAGMQPSSETLRALEQRLRVVGEALAHAYAARGRFRDVGRSGPGLEALARMYLADELTATEIAQRTGLSPTTVANRLRGAHIPLNRYRRQKKGPPETVLVHMYRDQHLTESEIARRTGLAQPTVSERLRSAGVGV